MLGVNQTDVPTDWSQKGHLNVEKLCRLRLLPLTSSGGKLMLGSRTKVLFDGRALRMRLSKLPFFPGRYTKGQKHRACPLITPPKSRLSFISKLRKRSA